jgi:ATP-dependent DNA helicase RecG
MARLIQGDVGSGKTVVAALAMLMMLEAGHQTALMAPTELLAEQHARTLESMFDTTPWRMHLLTSSVPTPDQRQVRAGLEQGTVRLVVGTHALLEESVRFRDLGLVVIDEQHRFGVAHRQTLLSKGTAPHLMVMTATPIPRSLALTVYGDLELSVIDELPPGRLPVTTVMRNTAAKGRVFDFLRRELAQGGRAYLVYPMIEASDAVTWPALEEHVAEVRATLPGVELGVLHGRIQRIDREREYRRFSTGEVQVLLATTVVEVGVDVPEASLIMIEGADRFGLSQLHQLRGRVGRGVRKSWCVLLADDTISEEARRRLEVLCRTNDGFEIAEADLGMRGPGELTGTRQWGPADFRFADLTRHQELVRRARDVARRLSASGEIEAVRRDLARYHPVEVELPAG